MNCLRGGFGKELVLWGVATLVSSKFRTTVRCEMFFVTAHTCVLLYFKKKHDRYLNSVERKMRRRFIMVSRGLE